MSNEAHASAGCAEGARFGSWHARFESACAHFKKGRWGAAGRLNLVGKPHGNLEKSSRSNQPWQVRRTVLGSIAAVTRRAQIVVAATTAGTVVSDELADDRAH